VRKGGKVKKILIFGATGMLGHKLYQVLSPDNDVVGTIRSGYKTISRYGFMEPTILVPRFDATAPNAAKQVIESIRPDVVVNCIGVINKLVDEVGIPATTYLNAELPHEMYRICQPKGIRLIHISTDCVFSGKKGNYTEDDPSDAEDVYGKTKYLGEVKDPGAITIRTSIIGRELHSANGLLEWFISKHDTQVEGWANAIFSGFPTIHLSRIIAEIITKHPDLSGLYNISTEPISKYTLLSLINKAFGLNIEIKANPVPWEDKSLDSTRFRKATGFSPLPWGKMITELAEDAAAYSKWR
jgi:dTDP-4-dehydrorhamnose reductase